MTRSRRRWRRSRKKMKKKGKKSNREAVAGIRDSGKRIILDGDVERRGRRKRGERGTGIGSTGRE